MADWVFPYGIWYGLAALGACEVASAATAGDVAVAVLTGTVEVVLGVALVRSRMRWGRSGEKALRAELARLIDERARTGAVAWRCRDENLLFFAGRRRNWGLREHVLTQVDEDLLRDAGNARDTGGGKVALTGVVYRVNLVIPRVLRRVGGTTALVTAAGAEPADPDERVPSRRRRAGAVRIVPSGHAYADAAELAEVTALLRDAEPVIPDGI